MITQRIARSLFYATSCVLLASGCALNGSDQTAATQRIDILFVNANVLTMTSADDDARPNPTVVAANGDKIVAVGSSELTQSYRARQTVDLAGKTLLPGFNDTHIHINGNARRYIDLTGVTSIADIAQLVAQRAEELGPKEWITGYGWSEDELLEQRKPTRHDLDVAAPDNPVVLTRAGAHSAVASSSALRLAGFNSATPDPQNGTLERDAAGELTGIVRERQDILLALVPRASDVELMASLSANLKDLFALGITSLTQAMADQKSLARWRKLYDEQPQDHPRAAVQPTWPGKEKFLTLDYRSGDGDEHFRIGPLKIFVDGGFTGPAAFTKTPYRGEQTYRGSLAITEEVLRERLSIAHNAGWQLGIHAIGDAAIELVVAELVALLDRSPRADHRHYLNHFTVLPGAATLQAMAVNDIRITQQPNFTYTLEGRYSTYLDGERLRKNNALRTPLDRGIFMALSSDILPIGPMTGIYAAVTRRGMSGDTYGPEEALTVQEALRGYTRNGAHLTFEEHIKGTIAPGMLADFVVFEDDPTAIPPEQLLTLPVDQTWLGGRQVYSRFN